MLCAASGAVPRVILGRDVGRAHQDVEQLFHRDPVAHSDFADPIGDRADQHASEVEYDG